MQVCILMQYWRLVLMKLRSQCSTLSSQLSTIISHLFSSSFILTHTFLPCVSWAIQRRSIKCFSRSPINLPSPMLDRWPLQHILCRGGWVLMLWDLPTPSVVPSWRTQTRCCNELRQPMPQGTRTSWADVIGTEEREVEWNGEGGHNEMERRRNEKDGRHNEWRGRRVTEVREKRCKRR